MVDIQAVTKQLHLNDDGIWYGSFDKPISYPSDGHSSCFSVEDNSFWFKHRNHCIITVVKSFPPEHNDTIFDIGGGNGFVSQGLSEAGFNVALVEPSATGASNARKRGLSDIICATVESAGFYPSTLPAVGLFDVIEHIENDLQFLETIAALMKKRAYLYVTVPSYAFLWSEEDVKAGHFRRYNLQSIEAVLKKAGFNVLFSTYIFRLLTIPVFLFRALPHKLGLSSNKDLHESASDDHIVKSNNVSKVLDVAFHSEIVNLRRLKPMSFGASCLLVAQSA